MTWEQILADRTRHRVMRAIADRRTTAMGPPLPVTSATLAAELEVPLIVVEETMADLYGAGFIDMRYGMRYTSADRWSATATEAGLRAFHPDESEEPTAQGKGGPLRPLKDVIADLKIVPATTEAESP